ncbi:MAG: ATP-binding protein [Elusimicrobiota bacterium]
MASLESILVADDDESWVDFCRSLLEAEGFEVATALSVHQAQRLVEGRPAFDVAFVDLCLPAADDGKELVAAIKARRPETDVILMTASPSIESAIAVLKDGACDYIVKPFDSNYLRTVLNRVVGARRSRKELGVERQLREELEAAYGEAKRLQKLREGFLARVSHELNTPLAQAMFAIELLDETVPPDPKLKARVQSADAAVKRLREVVEDLLDFVDVEKSDLSLDRKAVALPPLFRDIEEESRRLLALKRVTVSMRFPDGLPAVWGDTRLLARAFRQLFLNAIHFNTQGGVLEIAASSWEDQVVVHVRDQGEGIPREEKARCFDPFYQIAEYMTRKVGGLGLGLAITKRIVEAHGGSISVESPPDGGSDFRVTLPCPTPPAS